MKTYEFCIAIICFKRPDLLFKTIRSLDEKELSKKIPILFYVDGPRNNSEISDVNNTIAIVKQFLSSRDFEIRKLDKLFIRNKNIGLSNSVCNAVSNSLKSFESVLILEDDIVLKKGALEFCLNMLNKYKNDSNVISVGLNSPFDLFSQNKQFFKTKRATCWGWATWKNKWKLMIEKEKLKDINIDNYQKLYIEEVGIDSKSNLNDLIFKNRDMWACRWIFTHIKFGKYSIIPISSFTENLGLNGSGENFVRRNIDLIFKLKSILRKIHISRFFAIFLLKLFSQKKFLKKLEVYQLISYYSIDCFKNIFLEKKVNGIIVFLLLPLNIQLRYLIQIRFILKKLKK